MIQASHAGIERRRNNAPMRRCRNPGPKCCSGCWGAARPVYPAMALGRQFKRLPGTYFAYLRTKAAIPRMAAEVSPVTLAKRQGITSNICLMTAGQGTRRGNTGRFGSRTHF